MVKKFGSHGHFMQSSSSVKPAQSSDINLLRFFLRLVRHLTDSRIIGKKIIPIVNSDIFSTFLNLRNFIVLFYLSNIRHKSPDESQTLFIIISDFSMSAN